MISIKRFGCASLPPSRTNSSYNSLIEKTAKRENARDANNIFRNPVLLYIFICLLRFLINARIATNFNMAGVGFVYFPASAIYS